MLRRIHGKAGVTDPRRSGYNGYTNKAVRGGVEGIGEDRSSVLVSRRKRKRYAAWLGVYLEQSCETWSAGLLETGHGNAKGFKAWGVACNGSDRRHCLHGSRGRMRMSVYRQDQAVTAVG